MSDDLGTTGFTDQQFRDAIAAQQKVIKDFGPANAHNGVSFWSNKYVLAGLMVKYHQAYPHHTPLKDA